MFSCGGYFSAISCFHHYFSFSLIPVRISISGNVTKERLPPEIFVACSTCLGTILFGF